MRGFSAHGTPTELPLLVGIPLWAFICSTHTGLKYTQQAVVTAGGVAVVVPVVPTVGKQVFLRVVTAIPTVMRCMTPAVTTVKKAAVGGKKSPAGAGTKTAAWEKPLPSPPNAPPQPSPRGGSPFLLCFRWFCGTPSLGRALKNHRYFHFIGVVRRHYRAFTRRSGYDVG